MQKRDMHVYIGAPDRSETVGTAEAPTAGLGRRFAMGVLSCAAIVVVGWVVIATAAISLEPPILPASEAPRLSAAPAAVALAPGLATDGTPFRRSMQAGPAHAPVWKTSAVAPSAPSGPPRRERGLRVDLSSPASASGAFDALSLVVARAAPPIGLTAPRADHRADRPVDAKIAAGPARDIPPEALAARLAEADPELRDAYRARGYAPIFGDPADSVAAIAAAVAALDAHAAPMDGFDAALDRLRAAPTVDLDETDVVERRADLEVVAAEAALLYARRVAAGAIEPRSVHRLMDVDRPAVDVADLLSRIAASESAFAAVAAIAPASDDYRGLLRAYAVWRDASLDAAAPPVRSDETLRLGDEGPAVAALRGRLAALNRLATAIDGVDRPISPSAAPERFDEALEAELRAFQERRGLAADGVAGPRSLAALNRGAVDLARAAAANLERARWLNRPLGERRVEVNIPDFHARLIDGEKTLLKTRVVVGKAGRTETPEFSDAMTHVVVNPRWHVPRSIATKEILPALQSDPSYLARNNMTLMSGDGARLDARYLNFASYDSRSFPYRVRQESGPGNALGDVKFIFPNHHAVYLHDTPAKSLFRRARRDFSHGCVRVADPKALAENLLAPQSADPAALYRRLRAASGERYQQLDTPTPVHLFYRTVWIDAEGRLQIREDVYGRDRLVADALAAAGAPLPKPNLP